MKEKENKKENSSILYITALLKGKERTHRIDFYPGFREWACRQKRFSKLEIEEFLQKAKKKAIEKAKLYLEKSFLNDQTN